LKTKFKFGIIEKNSNEIENKIQTKLKLRPKYSTCILNYPSL
jgi:hypothetical protein